MLNAKEINYRTKAAYELVNSIPVPRSVDDVYSIGSNLQYCIRAKYSELADVSGKNMKAQFTDLAVRQLKIKKEIDKAANYNLNTLLHYFYQNGGPIMEDPVNETMAKDLRPFFTRLTGNFLTSLDQVADDAYMGKMSAAEMETAVNNSISSLYGTAAQLFPVDVMQKAFLELAEIERTV